MFFLKNRTVNKIEKEIMEYCYHELKAVDVEPKYGLFNFKCFDNAVDYASRFPDTEVVMGFYRNINCNHNALHFWCRRDGRDFEVSIGYKAKFHRYHEIRVIDKKDWDIIGSIFDDGLEYYLNKFTSPLERFLINYDRVV